MRLKISIAAIAFTLTGCVTTSSAQQNDDGSSIIWIALGKTAYVDGPRVTPIAVLEDSRCPINARCAHAGQLRIAVKVKLGSGTVRREMMLGVPMQIADGALTLEATRPTLMAGKPFKQSAYRFGFTFAGGL